MGVSISSPGNQYWDTKKSDHGISSKTLILEKQFISIFITLSIFKEDIP